MKQHKMKLNKKYFDYIKYGTKRVEIRVNDEKRRKLNIGDEIIFNNNDENDTINTKVLELEYFKNFEDLINYYDIEVIADKTEEKSELLKGLSIIYSPDDILKYGVVAIRIQVMEKSCGVITFKRIDNEDFVLIVKHNIGHIGLPKGHQEIGESDEMTGIREVKEETGIDVQIIGDFKEKIEYAPKIDTWKEVIYFIGIALNREVTPEFEEVQKAGFYKVSDAINKITHKDEKEVLIKAYEHYKKL